MSRRIMRPLNVPLALGLSLIMLSACVAPAATAVPPAPATAAPKPTDPPKPAATTAAPTAVPPAATATPQPKVNITVMTNRIGEQATLLQNIAKAFMAENPNITVDFQAPGKDYENLMKVKMAAKDLPDVFSTHGWSKIRYGEFLADLRDEPWAAQLDPAIKPNVTDEKGKVYVLPMDQEKTGMTYNADVLAKYNVKVPTTFDELLAACETIKTGSAGKVNCIHISGADSWPMGQWYDYMSTPLLISPKTNSASSLLDGTFDFSKYTWMTQQLVDFKAKGYLNKDVLTAKYSDSAQAFADGTAAFEFFGSYIIPEAQKINPKVNLGEMPVPAISKDDTPTLIGGETTTWGVWKDSKNIAAAKKFVAFYAKAANIKAVAESNLLPAGLTGVTVDAKDLNDFYAKYKDLRVLPYFDRVYLPSGMWDVLCKAGLDALAGTVTVEKANDFIKSEFLRLRAAAK